MNAFPDELLLIKAKPAKTRQISPVSVTFFVAVQNERDRISTRRPSYEDSLNTTSLSIGQLVNAEILSRQVG